MRAVVFGFTELNDLLAAARRLPDCDEAAKLHALTARLTEALESGGDVTVAAEALASAAAASLADDPWVQFETAARALHQSRALHQNSAVPAPSAVL